MKLSVILTGATGMVGEGVLHECLRHQNVEQVLIINRKPSGIIHPKLKEIIHSNFHDISSLQEQIKGYNSCFFCLGVSSVGMKEPEYTDKTFYLTMGFARTLAKVNPDLTFCYISGAHTDSTEKGRSMWARVKGKTENDLMKLFKNAFMFRPGYMHPTPGLKNTLPAYKYIKWMYPLLRVLTPGSVSTLKELGLAMINSASNGSEKRVLEVNDIVKLAKQ